MKTNKKLTNLLLLLIGGATLTLTGMNWSIGTMAWIAPVFLLLFTRNTKWYQLIFFFLIVAISGAISQTSNNLFHLPSVKIFNGISFGILYSVAYVLDKILYKKNKQFYYTLIFPASIILVEFAMNFVIGTWGSIAHTQFEIKPLLQISSVFGICGISFIVAWFPAVVVWAIENEVNWVKISKGILVYGSVLFAALLFGEVRMKVTIPKDKTVKVATVLSETDVHAFAEKESEILKQLAADYSVEIPDRLFSDSLSIQTLIKRTEDAIKQGAKIIVWNEIALIINQTQKQQLISTLKPICKENKVYVLASFLEESIGTETKPFNNKSVLVSPEGNVIWEYQKSFIHPYAEAPIINSGEQRIPVIQTEYGKLGNVICADLDIPNYIKQAGKENVDILLVPAYDWPEITPLHSEMACLEAIQFGTSLVRANGKGLTAVYDYMGNTVATSNTLTSDTKIMYANVPVQSENTIYSGLGNIIILLAAVFFVFIVVKTITNRKK